MRFVSSKTLFVLAVFSAPPELNGPNASLRRAMPGLSRPFGSLFLRHRAWRRLSRRPKGPTHMTRMHLRIVRNPHVLAVLVSGTLVAATGARAETTLFANITHDQETGAPGTTPPVTSTGDPRPMSFGTAVFVLNDAQTEMTMDATIYNIDVTGTQTPDTNDNLGAAHIHAGALPGANAGVRWGFFGSPDNDNNPDNMVFTPFASGVGGTFKSVWDQPEGNGGTTLTAQLPNILGGLAYINFHTSQFGGGEIRGQIGVVPEPTTFALLGSAALPLLALRRRRTT
jgi:hypothetical protein